MKRGARLTLGMGVLLIALGVFTIANWDVFDGVIVLVCGLGVLILGISDSLEGL